MKQLRAGWFDSEGNLLPFAKLLADVVPEHIAVEQAWKLGIMQREPDGIIEDEVDVDTGKTIEGFKGQKIWGDIGPWEEAILEVWSVSSAPKVQPEPTRLDPHPPMGTQEERRIIQAGRLLNEVARDEGYADFDEMARLQRNAQFGITTGAGFERHEYISHPYITFPITILGLAEVMTPQQFVCCGGR